MAELKKQRVEQRQKTPVRKSHETNIRTLSVTAVFGNIALPGMKCRCHHF